MLEIGANVLLYRGSVEVVQQLADLLAEAGIEYQIVGLPHNVMAHRESFGTAKANLEVSPEDMARAREVLDRWQRTGHDQVESLTRKLWGQVLQSVWINAGLITILYVYGIREIVVLLATFGWGVPLVLMALGLYERYRHHAQGGQRPPPA